MAKKQSPKKKRVAAKRMVYRTMLEDTRSGKRNGGYEGVKYESTRRKG